MRNIEFQTFIDLVTFDQNLVKIERDIQKSQEQQREQMLGIERLEHDFADIKMAQLKARKAVDEKELYMKVLDAKEAELKNKLAGISNQKEFKSLEKETLNINAQRLQHEQELLVLWNKLDALNAAYDAQRILYEQAMEACTTQAQTIQVHVADLQEQLTSLYAQRIVKEKNIPQEWLAMYVNMKGRVNNPVVPVVNDSCDACFYSITPRDLQQLRKNNLLQCKDCYRLLYVE